MAVPHRPRGPPGHARARSCAPRARSGTWGSRARPASSPRWPWRCWRRGALRRRDWPAWGGTALAVFVALALLLPSTLLQVGLRDATEPWFHTNDSTYQIEHRRGPAAGRREPLRRRLPLLGHGALLHPRRHRSPSACASARWPSSTTPTSPAPRSPAPSGGWCPRPFDDYRMFVLLMTLAGFAAAMAFRAPLSWRLVLGRAGRGQPDRRALGVVRPERRALASPLMVLAFALATRGRCRWAAAALAGGGAAEAVRGGGGPVPGADDAQAGVPRAELKRCAGVFGGVVAVVRAALPDRRPGRLLRRHGEVRRRHLQDRGLRAVGDADPGRASSRTATGSYPFALIALLTWLPLTVWLLRPGPSRRGAVGRRGGLLDLDPGAALHRPHLQQLLPGVADDGARWPR